MLIFIEGYVFKLCLKTSLFLHRISQSNRKKGYSRCILPVLSYEHTGNLSLISHVVTDV